MWAKKFRAASNRAARLSDPDIAARSSLAPTSVPRPSLSCFSTTTSCSCSDSEEVPPEDDPDEAEDEDEEEEESIIASDSRARSARRSSRRCCRRRRRRELSGGWRGSFHRAGKETEAAKENNSKRARCGVARSGNEMANHVNGNAKNNGRALLKHSSTSRPFKPF